MTKSLSSFVYRLPKFLWDCPSLIRLMSVIGTLRALEILRREIHVATITGKSQTMRNLEVNDGTLDLEGASSSPCTT
ncbi:hypothetical protein GYMLUDRAFT_668254 [Collybiopsis luxurians FD-317 M1]|uniref:Uncharacterized protein n=1 Tax=Collybiopsis luxurians FD-317 M1 TaxID=944289 RepID=A0A0D0B7J1_9AGAR|nr:hypothetical protein GYMLUDRAFT_668254 [Collybiopsis luxurians FD-317 M1]